MKTTLLTLAAAIATLCTVTSVEAGGYGCQTGHCRPVARRHAAPRYQVSTHCEPRGRQVLEILVLPGTARCFSHRSQLSTGHQVFYSPQHENWYYFYPQKQCFIPVKYLKRLPPVFNNNLAVNRNRNAELNGRDLDRTPALSPVRPILPVNPTLGNTTPEITTDNSVKPSAWDSVETAVPNAPIGNTKPSAWDSVETGALQTTPANNLKPSAWSPEDLPAGSPAAIPPTKPSAWN